MVKTNRPTQMKIEQLLEMLGEMRLGVLKHAHRWPGIASNAESLADLIADTHVAQAAYKEAKTNYEQARERLEGMGGMRGKLVQAFRLTRDTARTYFKDQLEDFGISPRARPRPHGDGPEVPENLRVVHWYETGVGLKWKPLDGRLLYEVFLALDSAEAPDQMVGSTNSGQLRLSDLEPGKDYVVRVRAKTPAAAGPKCDPLLVSMPRRSVKVL